MDGNGRWAKKQGRERTFGHSNGTTATIDLVDRCVELGIEFLTIYVFSSENWNRPAEEVKFLIELLLTQMIDKELPHMMEKNVRLQFTGDLDRLPDTSKNKLLEAIEQTSKNTGMQLNLAISYGGRREIMHGVQKIAKNILSGEITPEDINEELISSSMYLPEVPDPELMIRTGGEQRISNYLLWQCAYSELYFTDLLWPEFTKAELDKAIEFYSKKQRRFGRVIDE